MIPPNSISKPSPEAKPQRLQQLAKGVVSGALTGLGIGSLVYAVDNKNPVGDFLTKKLTTIGASGVLGKDLKELSNVQNLAALKKISPIANPVAQGAALRGGLLAGAIVGGALAAYKSMRATRNAAPKLQPNIAGVVLPQLKTNAAEYVSRVTGHVRSNGSTVKPHLRRNI